MSYNFNQLNKLRDAYQKGNLHITDDLSATTDVTEDTVVDKDGNEKSQKFRVAYSVSGQSPARVQELIAFAKHHDGFSLSPLVEESLMLASEYVTGNLPGMKKEDADNDSDSDVIASDDELIDDMEQDIDDGSDDDNASVDDEATDGNDMKQTDDSSIAQVPEPVPMNDAILDEMQTSIIDIRNATRRIESTLGDLQKGVSTQSGVSQRIEGKIGVMQKDVARQAESLATVVSSTSGISDAIGNIRSGLSDMHAAQKKSPDGDGKSKQDPMRIAIDLHDGEQVTRDLGVVLAKVDAIQQRLVDIANGVSATADGSTSCLKEMRVCTDTMQALVDLLEGDGGEQEQGFDDATYGDYHDDASDGTYGSYETADGDVSDASVSDGVIATRPSDAIDGHADSPDDKPPLQRSSMRQPASDDADDVEVNVSDNPISTTSHMDYSDLVRNFDDAVARIGGDNHVDDARQDAIAVPIETDDDAVAAASVANGQGDGDTQSDEDYDDDDADDISDIFDNADMGDSDVADGVHVGGDDVSSSASDSNDVVPVAIESDADLPDMSEDEIMGDMKGLVDDATDDDIVNGSVAKNVDTAATVTPGKEDASSDSQSGQDGDDVDDDFSFDSVDGSDVDSGIDDGLDFDDDGASIDDAFDALSDDSDALGVDRDDASGDAGKAVHGAESTASGSDAEGIGKHGMRGDTDSIKVPPRHHRRHSRAGWND